MRGEGKKGEDRVRVRKEEEEGRGGWGDGEKGGVRRLQYTVTILEL